MDVKLDETVKYGGKFDFVSINRPWGYQWMICENEKSITAKVIHIGKNEMLSLQRHKGRDQLYYIIDRMTIQYEDSDSSLVTVEAESGDTFYFPRGMLHRAINKTDKDFARFFEVAFGVNDESDIVRVSDKYSRADNA
jgi:oxalate decarboxylase/phosphoglucose isomerase-like protein (cupin superfamily)